MAEDFSPNLGISKSDCKLALLELQEGALRKLKAREEFSATGDLEVKNILQFPIYFLYILQVLPPSQYDALIIGKAHKVSWKSGVLYHLWAVSYKKM